MNRRTVPAIIGLILLLGLLAFIPWRGDGEDVVFVDADELYEGFELKKELEKKMEHSFQPRKGRLDSMRGEIRVLRRRYERSEGIANRDSLKARILSLQDRHQEFSRRIQNEQQRQQRTFNEQAIDRLQGYLEEYRKENDHDAVVAVHENGLTSVSDERMRTEEVLRFVNERYQGDR